VVKAILPLLFCAAGWAQSITIVKSGSTNTAGFQIVVQKNGDAEYTTQARRMVLQRTPAKLQQTIPKELADRLFADVAAARPLASLPARLCAKSASFGTRLKIEIGDEESPDLSCGDGGNTKLHALIEDANKIVKIFQPE
jgi:hypothetical protein